MSDPNALTTPIIDNATSPQTMSGDGISVTNNRIPDMILADKHESWKRAQANPLAGLQFVGLIPGGSQR